MRRIVRRQQKQNRASTIARAGALGLGVLAIGCVSTSKAEKARQAEAAETPADPVLKEPLKDWHRTKAPRKDWRHPMIELTAKRDRTHRLKGHGDAEYHACGKFRDIAKNVKEGDYLQIGKSGFTFYVKKITAQSVELEYRFNDEPKTTTIYIGKGYAKVYPLLSPADPPVITVLPGDRPGRVTVTVSNSACDVKVVE